MSRPTLTLDLTVDLGVDIGEACYQAFELAHKLRLAYVTFEFNSGEKFTIYPHGTGIAKRDGKRTGGWNLTNGLSWEMDRAS